MRAGILLADGDDDRRALLLEVLGRRYGVDYEVVGVATSDDALAWCASLRDQGRQVALVIASPTLGPLSGIDCLARVREHDRDPRLLLLLPWGALDDTQPLVDAVAHGRVDHFVVFTGMREDENMHLAVTELLAEYGRDHGPRFEPIRVVGDAWAPRSHELRDLLTRNGLPFGFYPADSDEGRELLAAADVDGSRLPVVLLADGRALVDPSNTEAARHIGADLDLGGAPYDVTIVGAGPAGLAAAVYASSEGLRTLVVEREAIGGQAGTSSMIRNYLGFPRGISGGDLAMRAANQAQLFGARLAVVVEAAALHPGAGVQTITLGSGDRVLSRAVIIATGVTYRTLQGEGLDRLTGAGVYYGAAVSEAPSVTGSRVYVVGGGNSAGQAAVHLARFADQVTLLVRRASLATTMSEYLITQLDRTPNIDVRNRTEVLRCDGVQHLTQLTLRDAASGTIETVPAAGLFVLIGGRPRTGWLRDVVACDPHGYVLTGADVPAPADQRARLPYETSVTGVFAVGDARHGSVKRVASAAGEGAVCISYVHQHIDAVVHP
ncbi:MAG TPA: FAD-dependent oxidoreductase [Euzebyales bacterium]|nr:FAD-dependent oxidoreductase [Euzebyales bacterium]